MKRYLKRYQEELFNYVIPFWEKYSIDKEYGGYFTFLDRDGTIYDTEKFMWMQWRIVYMFSELFINYKEKRWLEIAIKGYDFLVKNGKDKDGFYYFALNRKGEPTVAPYNIYSNCFAAMGSASLYKATGENKYKKEALKAINNYISRMDNPKGKWNKILNGRKRMLEFGHYMMLINLGLIMKEYLATDDFNEEIDNSIDMVLNYFWNEEYNVIFENINEDYTVDLDSTIGRHINPGHGLEAMWFLLNYGEKYNKKDIFEKIFYIIKSILEFGWDKKYGGIYYFMDVLGKPHIELQWNMKLWWVHNEASIATLYAFYLSNDKEFFSWFKKIDKWSFKHFSDNKYGEWFGYLNRRGEITHTLKGGKWKTFFHLPRFLFISIKLMEKIENKNNKKT